MQHRIIDDFIDHLLDSDITAIILADGYKASCKIRRITSMSVGTATNMSQIVTLLSPMRGLYRPSSLHIGIVLLCGRAIQAHGWATALCPGVVKTA